MIWWLYNLALIALSPVIGIWLVYRLAIRRKSRDGFAQRLGFVPARADGSSPIWVHAVSAGEMVAAAAVVRELRQRAPEVGIVVSTTTPAGLGQARRLIPGAHSIFYFPFDILPSVRLALSRVRPALFVAVETEIWPNFYREASRRGVRLAVVNGHFSDRTMRRLAGRARFLRPLYAAALRLVDRFGMQTSLDAERAIALGAEASRVYVCGNSKFDQAVASLTPGETARLRRAFGLREGQPLWIAGSTHPGEEEQILAAWDAVREGDGVGRPTPGLPAVSDLALMIAPRHVERADAVEELCVRRVEARAGACGRSHPVIRRSRVAAGRDGAADTEPHAPPLPPVILRDTVGELAAFYGLASVVFVGGSLAPIGGHDVLQPLFHGKPTFFGPHMHNQRDMAALAAASGAAEPVSDAGALAAAVRTVLTDPARARAMAGAATALLAANQGAAGRCADLILGLIGLSHRGGTSGDGETGRRGDGAKLQDLPRRPVAHSHPLPDVGFAPAGNDPAAEGLRGEKSPGRKG
jgi:3-deoxy-D-manno-octulosonic-acid transferase